MTLPEFLAILPKPRDLGDYVGWLVEAAANIPPELARAWIMQESSGRLDALGDHGRAFGILQCHNEFRQTFAPAVALMLYALGDIVTVGNFVRQMTERGFALDGALRAYHYGHVTDNDPDGYIAKVRGRIGK